MIAEVRDAEMYAFTAAWLKTNEPFRRDILALLEKEGPLLSRDIPDTSVEPWPSSGWTNNRNITRMLESLALRGHVAAPPQLLRRRNSAVVVAQWSSASIAAARAAPWVSTGR